MRRIIIRCIVFAVIIAAVTMLVFKRYDEKAAERAVKTAPEESGRKAEIEQEVTAFSIDGSSSEGTSKWHLTGTSAEIKEEEIHLYDLKSKVYSEKAVVDITSDKGIYRKTKGEVELLGRVKVVTDDGTTLETDRALWDQATKEVTTDSIVHIRREGMTAHGVGGKANSDEKTAVLRENVTVTMEPDTVVDCDGRFEVDYNKNTAVFYDNVRVKDKDGFLFSDKLTINFSPETEEVVQGVAEGNVKVKRGKSYTMSEKAIYTESTKSAKLLGRPRIIIDPEELEELEKQENDEKTMFEL